MNIVFKTPEDTYGGVVSFRILEERLGLQCGIVSAVMERGVEAHYIRFTVSPKKQMIRRQAKIAKKRTIFAPINELKTIQRAIARLISKKFNAHSIAHAYANSRSIVTNARQHLGAHSILKIDLVDFFGSISRYSVIAALGPLLADFSDREVEMIADLCCYNGFLPQGAHASPVLSNLVCYQLDVQLEELAQKHGCKVTRFSDDITFSTTEKIFPPALARTWKCGLTYEVELEPSICSLLQRQGFVINPSKLTFRHRPSLLKITGLVIGNGVRVPREFQHNLRAGLHQWERFGLTSCASAYSNGCAVGFTNSLRGSIEYIGQVQGRDCARYRRALADFNALLSRDEKVLLAAQKAKIANVITPRIDISSEPSRHASDRHAP